MKVGGLPAPSSSGCCKAYLANRAGAGETFLQFSRRTDIDALKAMVDCTGARRMTIQDARTGSVPLIPESARSRSEQRAWLNGFFAGLLSLDAKAGISPLTGELPDAAAKALAGDGDDGEAPWHDAAMPIDERMQLAEGRPLKRKLFAAMAQQDCGQCGYLCETYSAAIAAGTEAKLNLCVPGGKETSRMLKRLLEEVPAAPPRRSTRRRRKRLSRRSEPASAATAAICRSRPCSARRRASTGRARRRTRAMS